MTSHGSPPPNNENSVPMKKATKIYDKQQNKQCRKNAEWEGMNFFLNFPKIEWNKQHNKIVKVGAKSIENVPYHTLSTCIKLFQHSISNHEKNKESLINIFTNIAEKVESGHYDDLKQFKDDLCFKPYLMFTLRKFYIQHLKALYKPPHDENSTSPVARRPSIEPDSEVSPNDINSSIPQSSILMQTSVIELIESDDDRKSSKRKFEHSPPFHHLESSDEDDSITEMPSILPPIYSYSQLLSMKKDWNYTQNLYGLENQGKSCYISAAVQAIVSCIPHLVGLDLKLILSCLENGTNDVSKLKHYALPLVNLLVSMTINPIEQSNINKNLRELWKGMNKDGEFVTTIPNDAGNCFDALIDSISTILFMLYDQKNMYYPFLNLHMDSHCDNAWQALIDNGEPGKIHWIVSNYLGSVVKEKYKYSKCECGYQHPRNTNYVCHLKFVLDAAHIKTKTVKLETLLENHFKESCSTKTCPHLYCSKKINCTKSPCLYNLPKLLILEVNRMFKKVRKSNSNEYVKKKFNGTVLTPIRGLDLSSFLFKNDQCNKTKKNKRNYSFDLMHVIAHHENAKGSCSHFTNYHLYKNSCWYHINDKSIVECNDMVFKKDIHSKNKCFLLIYKLRESMF